VFNRPSALLDFFPNALGVEALRWLDGIVILSHVARERVPWLASLIKKLKKQALQTALTLLELRSYDILRTMHCAPIVFSAASFFGRYVIS
jgi:hypothetical protein